MFLLSNHEYLVEGQHCVSSRFVHLRCAPRARRNQQMTSASIIKCFGAFSGGAFIYWEEDDGGTPVGQLSIETARNYDTRREMVLYDGSRCHAIAPFEGEFYSLVFSTCESYVLLAPRAKKTRVEIGAIWPEQQACAYWDSLLGPTRSAKKNKEHWSYPALERTIHLDWARGDDRRFLFHNHANDYV